MKLRILLLATMLLSSLPINSMAEENYYLRGGLGIGMPMDSDIDQGLDFPGSSTMGFDTGLVGTLAAGYDFAGPFRLELEYLWQKNDLDHFRFDNLFGPLNDGDLRTQAFMINGYYDIDTGSPWTPFVGLGGGWGNLNFDGPRFSPSGSDDVFAYQFIGGVSYALDSQWSVDVQYRFLGASDATIDGADFNMNSNDLILGIRYNF